MTRTHHTSPPEFRRRGRTFWLGLLIVVLLGAATVRPAIAQGPRSGNTVVTFLTAIDAGDLDAAVALMDRDITVTLPDGTTLVGIEPVRQYFEALFRSIVICDRRPLGRGRYEAFITTGEQPLLLRVRGLFGLIAEIRIEQTDACDQDTDASTG